jgi:hypothetical protein
MNFNHGQHHIHESIHPGLLADKNCDPSLNNNKDK